MDIRSSEGQFIKAHFDRSYMRIRDNRLTNTATNQVFARTTNDRLVRIDVAIDQINVLDERRQHFTAVRSLAAGEDVLAGPGVAPLTREELLPPLTLWQAAVAYVPWASAPPSKLPADTWPRPPAYLGADENRSEPLVPPLSARFGAGLLNALGFKVPANGFLDTMLRDAQTTAYFALVVGIPLMLLGATMLQSVVVHIMFFTVCNYLRGPKAAH